MSTDKPDEALKRLLFEKAFMRHYTNGAHLLERFDTGHYRSEEARAAWQIACIFSASLAAHEAEQEQTAASELDRERAARREAQIELERYKSLLSRARIDLMRELREQGWVLQEQAGEAVAWLRTIDHGGGKKSVHILNKEPSTPQFPALETVQPLYTRPQQPLSDEQIAVLKFLDGSGLLRGAGYGCLPYGERRPFWWRRQLGDAFPQIRAHGITKDTSHNASLSGGRRPSA